MMIVRHVPSRENFVGHRHRHRHRHRYRFRGEVPFDPDPDPAPDPDPYGYSEANHGPSWRERVPTPKGQDKGAFPGSPLSPLVASGPVSPGPSYAPRAPGVDTASGEGALGTPDNKKGQKDLQVDSLASSLACCLNVPSGL